MPMPSWQDRRGTLRVCDPAMGDGVFLIEALRQMTAWLALRSGNDPRDIRIKRFVADELLFGVDSDPGAVEAARDALSREVEQHVDPNHFAVGDALVGPMLLAPERVSEKKKPDWYAYAWMCEQTADWSLGGTVASPHDWTKWPPITCWIGNPPFMGGGKISGTLGEEYRDYLKEAFSEWHGNADLCAAFFRRAAEITPPSLPATISFIATNTISQGDTRISGLRWLVWHGWTIYDVVKSMPWPGDAKVSVSIVNLFQTDQWGSCENAPRCTCGRDQDEVATGFVHACDEPSKAKSPMRQASLFEGVP